MATWPTSSESPGVLQAAVRFRTDCLIADGSIFQSGELWTAENFSQLKTYYVDHPLLGPQPFYSKLQQQLAGAGSPIIRLAAEAVWLLLLFPHENQFGPDKKRQRILQIMDDSSKAAITNKEMLTNDVLKGVGHPGAAFLTKIPNELKYLVNALLRLKALSDIERRQLLETDPWRFCELVTTVEGAEARGFRHMLLFLCYPDVFERIASRRHKQLIYSAFKELIAGKTDEFSSAPSPCTLDKSIFAIRTQLTTDYQTSELDFYREPLRSRWKAEADEPKATDQPPTTQNTNVRRFWVEKTIVKGRADRLAGPNRVGLALWSPQKSADGRDIYSNMRRVAPGDRVLHFTDNAAITGVSIAEAAVDDTFQGVAGTTWGEQPSYRVPLSDFNEVEPPLPREVLFNNETIGTRLKQIAESHKGLFYSGALELNQGAYLTEAPTELVEILNDAYVKLAGRSLPHIDKQGETKVAGGEAGGKQPYTFEQAVNELFLDQSEIEESLRVWKAKKNIILKGPPGVGKTFAARRLAYALSGYRDNSLIEFIQFHQSYSYEDFIEGYRPLETGGFELRMGRFYEFCKRATANKDTYVFIIMKLTGEISVRYLGNFSS